MIPITYVHLEGKVVAEHRPVAVKVGEGNRPVGPRLRSETGG